MDHTISAWLFAGALLAGMLLLFEIGFRLRSEDRAREPKDAPGLAAVEAEIFALFGLLIAFAFYGSMERFDAHRSLIAEEADTIGTAYLRLDLLPKDAQLGLRRMFCSYLDARLAIYRKLPDVQASEAARFRAKHLQNQIWSQAVSASTLPGAHLDAAKLLLPALNSMFDITTTREMASNLHPPKITFALLFALGLGCAFLVGYGTANRRRGWLHIIGFAVVIATTVYVVLDIEFPRRGLIRADAYDQVLMELREEMK